MLSYYSIEINSAKAAPQIADNVLRHFFCCISKPSSWVLAGNTNESGLTFLDADKQQLISNIFKNQAFFTPPVAPGQSEAVSIELFIYQLLFEHYRFDKNDIKVKVTALP